MVNVVHSAARNVRRAAGTVQSRRANVTGIAAQSVLRGIRFAQVHRAGIDRIEHVRQLLLTSPDPLLMDDMPGATTTTIARMAEFSKPVPWAWLLYCVAREVQPERALEMGSCVGISAAYQVAAMHANGHGRLITLEGSRELADRSQWTLNALSLDRAEVRHGHFSDTFERAVDDLKPVDWAFIDGNHNREPTLEYADRLLQAAGPETVHIFDDINWSDGMRQAWAAIKRDPRYQVTFDLRSVGIAVSSVSATERRNFRIGYY